MPRPSLTAATTAPSKHSQRLDRLLQHMQPSHSAPPLQPAATAQPAMSTRNHNHQAQTSINSLPLHPPAHSGHRPATTSTIDDPYPPASNPSALLSPLQASFNLAHSSSYSASLTSHHTAATPSHASTLSTTDPFQPRRLQRSDYHAGFLSLLSQLTDVGEVSEPLFNGRFDELSRVSDTQQVWVIEDAAKGRVIATATLLIELKFIHGVSKVSGWMQTRCSSHAEQPILVSIHSLSH